MFSIDDYWLILKHLQGETVLALDDNTKSIADSEKGVSTQMFENTLDQSVFATDDYKRLRSFLIDWYAVLRTVGTTEMTASAVFSLPDSHVQELIQSFGYDFPTELLSFTTKVFFFLDLINLYKVKGTPVSLLRLLSYYGFNDLDLVEYDLMLDDSDVLVFRGKRVRRPEVGEFPIPYPDIEFEEFTQPDPHWMLSYADVIYAHDTQEMTLPSRSPYFGLRPRYRAEDLTFVMSLLERLVAEQYELWLATGRVDITDPDIAHIYDAGSEPKFKITLLNYRVSLLELYLACVYSFNKLFGRCIIC